MRLQKKTRSKNYTLQNDILVGGRGWGRGLGGSGFAKTLENRRKWLLLLLLRCVWLLLLLRLLLRLRLLRQCVRLGLVLFCIDVSEKV